MGISNGFSLAHEVADHITCAIRIEFYFVVFTKIFGSFFHEVSLFKDW